MKKRCDIAIIGGGAAGLACGASLSRASDCSVILLDRMPKLGKKLLVTGNGRCNLSNRLISDEYYHGSFDVKPILEEYPDLRQFFEKMGLYTACDLTGRIYPLSNTAASVAETLILFAQRRGGVQLLTDTPCTSISKHDEGFFLKSGDLDVFAKAVVLTSGGCASPVHGSDGSGFALAKSLGIDVTPVYPALCSLLAEGTKPLEGVRSRCAASLFREGALIKRELGEVQFTKNALSGICIFNLSAVYENRKERVSLDLLPDYTPNDTYRMLYEAARIRRGASIEELFGGIFNYKIAQYLIKKASISASNSKGKASLDFDQIKRLAFLAKNLEFEIKGRADFSAAQVTAGGIPNYEIDGNLMSRKVKGLFFAGEIIDLWGDCGGYNLHFAFASGIKAGKEAAKYLQAVERKSNDKNKRA